MKLTELGFHKTAGILNGLRRGMLNRRMSDLGENMGRRATDFAADGRKMVPRGSGRRGLGGDHMPHPLASKVKRDPADMVKRNPYAPGRRSVDFDNALRGSK